MNAGCSERFLSYNERFLTALVIALLLAVALLFASCTPCTPASPHPLTDDQYGRTVQVITICTELPALKLHRFYGSGVRVGAHVVLTAKHVVTCPNEDGDDDDTGMVMVRDYDGDTFIAYATELSDSDVAHLYVPDIPALPPARIGKAERGDTVCATYGWPEWGRRCGEVWPRTTLENPSGGMHAGFVAEHGNSGAGVWSEKGELVGIVVHLRYCAGIFDDAGLPYQQVCSAGITALAPRPWLAVP